MTFPGDTASLLARALWRRLINYGLLVFGIVLFAAGIWIGFSG